MNEPLDKYFFCQEYAAKKGISIVEALRLFDAWWAEEKRIVEEEAAAAKGQLREAWKVPGELESFIDAMKSIGQPDEEIDELIGNVLNDDGESNGQAKN